MTRKEVTAAESSSGKPSVFVSFSGRDPKKKELVGRLLARLSEQRLRPWIYESAEEEIQPGQDIVHECLARLEMADLAIVVVSDEAFNSQVTAIEVEQALMLHQQERVELLCVSQTETPKKDWPSPFSALSRWKHCALRKEEDIEGIVLNVCSRANVDYLPETAHPRDFPLVLRIHMELKISSAIHKDRATGSFREALRQAHECEAAYGAGYLMTAFTSVEKLISLCEREFEANDVYYPRIAAGVIALELGRNEGAFVERGREHFKCAKQRRYVDENASAGLGLVAMRCGDASGALSCFMEASQFVPVGSDPALEHNLVLSALVAEGEESREVLRARYKILAPGAMTTMPGSVDRVRFLYLLASHAVGQAKTSEMRRLMAKTHEIPEDISLYLVDAIANWNGNGSPRTKFLALETAEQLLALIRYPNGTSATEDFRRKLTHRVAWLYFETNHLDRAQVFFRLLVEQYPRSARHLIDLFVFSRFIGQEVDRDRAARVLLEMKRPTDSRPEVSQTDFDYFLGLVQWDERELGASRESFRRSGAQDWYDESLAWLPQRLRNVHNNCE